LTALLATLLFWFGTFSIQYADQALSQNLMRFEETVTRAEKRVAELEAEREAAAAEGDTNEAEDAEHWIQGPIEEAEAAQAAVDQLTPWETSVGLLRIFMPETNRTLSLLHRELERDSEVSMVDLMSGRAFEDEDEPPRELNEHEAAQMRMLEEENKIPAWRIIGKSLIFEGIVLGFALWIFRRRDY
jgi:hypothetical protein